MKNFILNILHFLITISIIITIMYGLYAGCLWLGETECNNKYNDTKFYFIGGCMVKYEGHYIPESLYKKAFERNMNLNLSR